ncbi:MAG: hypothetical protein FJ010_14225 [Chloroflexi bacterium]|nr:hypothetical protein [Chloroflexota bacterium]
MWYATFEIGKIKMQEAIHMAQTGTASRHAASDHLLASFGRLLVVLGQRLQTRQQYGIVLHAG